MDDPIGLVLSLAGAGNFGLLRRAFAPAQRRRLRAENLRRAWKQHVSRHGEIHSVEAVGVTTTGAVRKHEAVLVSGEKLHLVVSTDERGRLVNIQVNPVASEWDWPQYANPESFDEHDLPLLGVRATLTTPRMKGNSAAVVLLAGGGPFDRDMTMGHNKIGKDLAAGLATRGIASLRYDKPVSAATPTEEYVPYAHAALGLLRADSRVDPARTFILGHSMGASWAPRAAESDPALAGLVLLAPQAQPMHEAAVRVLDYLAALDPTDRDARAAATAMARQARKVGSATLSPRTPPRKLPFSYSTQYWLDVRDHDPADVFEHLELPALILQGGRDYQVTPEDDFALWLSAADRRPGTTTTRLYPEDNHLFFVGSGRPDPAEYDAPQHVDPRVVDDVALWIDGVGAD